MFKKQTIRINENQLKRIVTEAVKRIIREEYEKVNGTFAVITYLPLINEYRVEEYDYVYQDNSKNGIQTPGVRNSISTKRFSTEKEAEEYCNEHNLDIIERKSLNRIGFPDIRSIRPNQNPFS